MDTAQLLKAVEEANAGFGGAVRPGDAAATFARYTKDAGRPPPNSGRFQGKEGLDAHWAGGDPGGILANTADACRIKDVSRSR